MGRAPPPPHLFISPSKSSTSANGDGLHRRPITPITDNFQSVLALTPTRPPLSPTPIPLTPRILPPEQRRDASSSSLPTINGVTASPLIILRDEVWVVLRAFREVLYVLWLLVTVALFVVSAIMISTSRSYYASSVGANVELLIAALFTLILITPLHYYWRSNHPQSTLSSLLFETLVTTSLWLLFLGGAASFSTTFPRLSACSGYPLCDQARILKTVAWVEWTVSTVLLAELVAVGALIGKNWAAPFSLQGIVGLPTEDQLSTKDEKRKALSRAISKRHVA